MPENGARGAGGGIFSPEDREKLRAARDKAMQDENVKTAREKMRAASEEFRKVLRPALLAQDRSLAPILDKMEKAEKERIEKRASDAAAGRLSGEGPAGPMAILTKEEREKLDAARDKVKENAEVKAAREKQDAAAREFRDVMRAAMIAADASVAPLLDKLTQARGRVGAVQGTGGPAAPGENPPPAPPK